jgi:hypothetical protein
MNWITFEQKPARRRNNDPNVWRGHSSPRKAAVEDERAALELSTENREPGTENPMSMTIFVCAVFTFAALYYVFFFPGEVYAGEEKTRLGYLRERKEAVYENLRDLNFEYKAGKVPDADYQSMRNSLEEEAAAIMAEIDRLELTAEV